MLGAHDGYSNVPLLGIPAFQIVYTGFGMVYFIDIDDILAAGCSLQTVPTVLEGMSPLSYQNCIHGGVGPGDAFFVPLGYVAVLVGIADEQPHPEYDHLFTVMLLCFDTSRFDSVTHEGRGELKNHIRHSMGKANKAVSKPVRNVVSMWVDAFPVKDLE